MSADLRAEFEALWARIEGELRADAMHKTLHPRSQDSSRAEGQRSTARLPRLGIEPGAVGERDEAPFTAADAAADIELRELLGEGGDSRVYLATQHSLERAVAVKVPRSEEAHAALLREARVAGSLEHPNIVPVHQLGVDAAANPVLVMKRVEGVRWKDLLQDRSHASWRRLPVHHEDPLVTHLEVLMQVCNALQFAHAQKVLHRDVKPENVMIGEFGEVYLLGWGVALRLDRPDEPPSARPVGTLVHMAPEMVSGRAGDLDARTDVFLLGATLHYALTGRPRHEGASVRAVLEAAFACEPHAYGPDVPRELAALCNGATARDPSKRPATVAAFRQSLADYLEHRASVALSASAEKSLEALRAQPGVEAREVEALTGAQAWQRMTEARFGFLQALRAWSGNEAAHEGLYFVRRFMFDREIALKNPSGARSLLGELQARDPELEARVARLEASIDEARALEGSERARQREMDLSASERPRRRALALQALLVVLIGAGFTLRARQTGAPPRIEQVLGAEVFLLAIAAIGAVLFRERIRGTLLARKLHNVLLLSLGSAIAIDGLALARGISGREACAPKLLAVAAVLVVGAIQGFPGMLLGVAVMIAGLLGLLASPEGYVWITPATLAATTLVLVWVALTGRFTKPLRP